MHEAPLIGTNEEAAKRVAAACLGIPRGNISYKEKSSDKILLMRRLASRRLGRRIWSDIDFEEFI